MPVHDHRSKPGHTRSAIQLGEDLAIPCLYLLAGKAQAVFPNTHTAAPSSWVSVMRLGEVRDICFPPGGVTVHWKQWRDVVVPVLDDPRWAPENPLWAERFGELLVLLGLALRQSGEVAGYGNPDDLLDC